MEEILHHLVRPKPCKWREKLSAKWCRSSERQYFSYFCIQGDFALTFLLIFLNIMAIQPTQYRLHPYNARWFPSIATDCLALKASMFAGAWSWGRFWQSGGDGLRLFTKPDDADDDDDDDDDDVMFQD